MTIDFIDGTGVAKWEMPDGDGPAATLSMDGLFQLTLRKITRNTKVSDSGNTTISLSLVVQDEDLPGAKGALIYDNMPVTGKVGSGSREGEDNIQRFLALATSAGRTDIVEAIKGQKLAIAKFDSFLQSLSGANVYARLAQQPDGRNGDIRSKVVYYVTQEKYTEARESGVNFRTQPNPQFRGGAGGNRGRRASTAGLTASADVGDDL